MSNTLRRNTVVSLHRERMKPLFESNMFYSTVSLQIIFNDVFKSESNPVDSAMEPAPPGAL